MKNPWFRGWNAVSGGSRLRLFCFHHAGGTASFFREWPSLLGNDVEVVAVQLPGRENRRGETMCTCMDALIGDLQQAMVGELDKPFAFFGHSLGALVAFELARCLELSRQQTPSHLYVSGRIAPQCSDSLPPIGRYTDDELLRELQLRYGGIPPQVIKEEGLLQFFLPVLRADLQLLQSHTYIAEPRLKCPITAFTGISDPNVHIDNLERWADQTVSIFRSERFPGGHFYIKDVGEQVAARILENVRTDEQVARQLSVARQ
ncbi:thioesterase II family protein [Paraburkholderia sp. RL17-337-BIB-A]|uniref:thioesterase II family protein n=1 Tax=Paraburkholderia sp. RL17-337-BIB-A TaxID=3031636 RepID=UPI0038BD0415